MASFSISWLHGFQVLQVSSPDPPAQLGLGGANGVSLCRSVSWIVRLEETSELRGELFDVVFPFDFGGSDLVLEA